MEMGAEALTQLSSRSPSPLSRRSDSSYPPISTARGVLNGSSASLLPYLPDISIRISYVYLDLLTPLQEILYSKSGK